MPFAILTFLLSVFTHEYKWKSKILIIIIFTTHLQTITVLVDHIYQHPKKDKKHTGTIQVSLYYSRTVMLWKSKHTNF